jgi:aspartate aminotransferase-like enzyme
MCAFVPPTPKDEKISTAQRRLKTIVNHLAHDGISKTQQLKSSSTAALLDHVDPSGLLEYSVVYTDRSLNHMSVKFQQVMIDISVVLKRLYKAESVVVVPGSGTYAMEAVARQFGTGRKCLVIRNGYFSYRWSQIFQAASVPSEEIVLKARPVTNGPQPQYAPAPLHEVVETIMREKPEVVFAAHVETACGLILPDEYIKAVGDAVHRVGGLFVLDCVASGCIWVDMAGLNVDVIISAPQKDFSGPPCAGLVMMSQAAKVKAEASDSSSFAIDLKKWMNIMTAYENGGHMYHTTMPTDALKIFRDVLLESAAYGFEKLKQEQWDLGTAARYLLLSRGERFVAAEGFWAPSVVVSYTDDMEIKSGAKFAKAGMQIAAGVPLMVDDYTESADFKTFRLGLFGLAKIQNIPRTVQLLQETLDKVLPRKVAHQHHRLWQLQHDQTSPVAVAVVAGSVAARACGDSSRQ